MASILLNVFPNVLKRPCSTPICLHETVHWNQFWPLWPTSLPLVVQWWFISGCWKLRRSTKNLVFLQDKTQDHWGHTTEDKTGGQRFLDHPTEFILPQTMMWGEAMRGFDYWSSKSRFSKTRCVLFSDFWRWFHSFLLEVVISPAQDAVLAVNSLTWALANSLDRVGGIHSGNNI